MVNKTRFKCKKFIFFALFLSALSLSAQKFIYNDGVIGNKAEVKMQEMGNELFSKTGISAYLYAIKDMNNQTLSDFEKKIAKGEKEPFVVLMITLKEQKVDIFNSKNLDKTFDKEQILSPYSWSGSIIPLLVGKKKDVNVGAAMLNGYSDLVEQIASSKNVKLKSGIGSTNRDIIFFVKMSIYLFVLILLIRYLVARVKKGNQKYE